MYAVVRTGGKQYRVEPGMLLEIEKVAGDVGDTVELGDVLLVADGTSVTVGQPLVSGALISGEIVSQHRGPKLMIFKKRRRQGYRRFKGHRQDLTTIKVQEIKAG